MTESWQGIRHRVLVPQALGADEFLRATWHERDRIIVFSHWSGDSCLAATPVRITDVPELAELLVRAIGHAAVHPAPDIPALRLLEQQLDAAPDRFASK
jgi:hypothetical protein